MSIKTRINNAEKQLTEVKATSGMDDNNRIIVFHFKGTEVTDEMWEEIRSECEGKPGPHIKFVS